MKVTLYDSRGGETEVEFDKYSRVRFYFDEHRSKYIEVRVSDFDGAVEVRSGWGPLVVHPHVTNVIQVELK